MQNIPPTPSGSLPSDLLTPHHHNVTKGTFRAAVFGVSDGLVSNVSLVLGVAGAHPTAALVRLTGLAGLVAGACSMAAGEYVSMKAQTEFLEHELKMERVELTRSPERERQELIAIYESRGVTRDLAEQLAVQLMANPEVALETHAREELGVDPNSLGSPIGAAASSLVAFAGGAIVPLAPWFFWHGGAAVLASVVLSAVGALLIGWLLASFSSRSRTLSALRQLCISGGAAAITYLIGQLVGTSQMQ